MVQTHVLDSKVVGSRDGESDVLALCSRPLPQFLVLLQALLPS